MRDISLNVIIAKLLASLFSGKAGERKRLSWLMFFKHQTTVIEHVQVQWQMHCVYCNLQEAAASAKAAEDKAAHEEADRQQRFKDSFDAQMPDEINQKVQAALQKEMVGHKILCIAPRHAFLVWQHSAITIYY